MPPDAIIGISLWKSMMLLATSVRDCVKTEDADSVIRGMQNWNIKPDSVLHFGQLGAGPGDSWLVAYYSV
jgi:hypothetical protein